MFSVCGCSHVPSCFSEDWPGGSWREGRAAPGCPELAEEVRADCRWRMTGENDLGRKTEDSVVVRHLFWSFSVSHSWEKWCSRRGWSSLYTASPWGEVIPQVVAQLCPTLWNPMDCSPPGSSVPGILQARILELVAIPFSRGSSWPRIFKPGSSALQAVSLLSEPPGKPLNPNDY